MLHSSMANAFRVLFALLLFTGCDAEIHAEMDADIEVGKPYPRKVIVHTAYDYGFATRMADGIDQRVFAEDEQLIEMVESGEYLEDAVGFGARVVELGGHVEPLFPWTSLEVQIVFGPYILTSQGGNEMIMERDGVDWW